MKDKPWFAVVYMFVITAFFSSVVIGVATFTKDLVDANEKLAFEKAVLQVAVLSEGIASSNVHETYIKRIKAAGQAGDLLNVKNEQGITTGYVLPIEGKGFWAPIKGVLGLAGDKRTITGIAFYEQNETPGLGGKIAEKQFREQFISKKLKDGQRPIEFKSPGLKLDNAQVHSITGATQTCVRLEKFMNEDILTWRENQEGLK